MYRLHNNSIEAKIDWLVKNEHILDKKIVISPWDADGMQCYKYLTEKWGGEAIIIDDEVCHYNRNVLSFDSVHEKNQYTYLIFCIHSFDLKNRLKAEGVSEESIFVLKGDPLTGQDALLKCVELPNVETVLDVGCGKGNHSNIFAAFGKKVTGIDAGFSCDASNSFVLINDDFEKHVFKEQYDLVWCSHVLEHQMNTETFIKKLFSCCKDGGYVAITVPDENGWIIEGHVAIWNVGELLCNIIHCGYDCKHAMAKTYHGNVSVIVPKEPIGFDVDYRALDNTREYYPFGLDCGATRFGGVRFNGNIESINWS